MKIIALFMLALGLSAQTKPNLLDIKPPSAPAASVYLFGMFPGVGLIAIDATGLTLDKTTNPPTLRLIAITPPGTAGGQDFDDIFTVSSGQVAFVSTSAPTALVRVFKNGALQRLNSDYTLTIDSTKIATVIFLPTQGITQGDSVTLCYQR
jgi:hypothetical protein